MLNCAYVPSFYSCTILGNKTLVGYFVCDWPIVIEDLLCKPVSLPDLFQAKVRQFFGSKDTGRPAAGSTYSTAWCQLGKRPASKTASYLWRQPRKHRGFFSVETLIRREITRDFTQPGIGVLFWSATVPRSRSSHHCNADLASKKLVTYHLNSCDFDPPAYQASQ